MVFHGPVAYLDDVDDWLHSATSEQEYFLRALFSKNRSHHAQREYRFVVWAENPPENDTPLLRASPALVDAMTRRRTDPSPPMVPRMAWVADDSASRDSAIRNSSYDEKMWPDLPCPAREQANQPEAVVRPHSLNPAPLPEDFRTRTSTYSGVEALRQKITDFHWLENETVESRNDVTAAAWFAEQDIRSLCASFDDPIRGISITPDGFIEIHVALGQWPDLDCRLAVAPTGEAAIKMDAGPHSRFVESIGQFYRANMGEAVREFVERGDQWSRNIEQDE